MPWLRLSASVRGEKLEEPRTAPRAGSCYPPLDSASGDFSETSHEVASHDEGHFREARDLFGGRVLRQEGVRPPREAEGGLSEEGRQGEHPQGGRRDRRGAARPDGRDPAQRRDDGRLPVLPSGRDRLGGRGPQRKGGQERARCGRKARSPPRHEGVRDAGSAAAQGTGSRGAEDLVSLRRAAEEGYVAPGDGDPPQRPPGTLPRGRCRNGPPRETSRRRGRRRAEDHCSDRTGPDPDIARQIAREIYGRGVELEVWVQLGSLCGTLVATSRGFQRSRCHERKVTPLRFACPGPVSG